MLSSENKLFAHMSPEAVLFHASVVGAGAAAPTVPTTTFSGTSSLAYMARSNNFVSTTAGDIVRSGAGVYTIKLRDGVPVVLDIMPKVWGADGKQAQIADYNPTTRVISVNVFDGAGVAADLAVSDVLKLTIIGQLSVPNY